MKKFNKILITALIVTLLATVLSGCNLIKSLLSDSRFSVAEDSVTLKIGEERVVSLASNSAKESYKLSSSDTSKVEVIGDTTIKGVGKTTSAVTVTATSDSGKTDTISVTVVYAEVGSLSIGVADGSFIQLLDDSEDAAPVTFEAVTNDGIDPNTPFTWTVTDKLGVTQIMTGHGASLVFPANKFTRNETYVVKLTAGTQTATKEFGAFNSVYISTDKSAYKVNTDVTVGVTFRLSGSETGTTAKFTLYQNGVNKGLVSAAYTASDGVGTAELTIGPLAQGSYSIYLVYNGDSSNTVAFDMSVFDAVNHVNVSATGGNLVQSGVAQNVTFTATVSPANADVGSVNWYVNDVLQSATGATFTFLPTGFAEYHVSAKLDKVESGYLTIVRLNSTDARSEYATNTFDYGGYPQNTIISNQRELNNVVVYIMETQKYTSLSNSLPLYFDFDYGADLEDEFSKAQLSAVESGILPAPHTSGLGNEYKMWMDFTVEGQGVVNSPSVDAADIAGNTAVQSAASVPHYDTTVATRNFYIDDSTKTMAVNTSNLLYKAVGWGYKPVFESNAKGTLLQQIYDNAREVLSKICTDDMTEYEKVHAIYDWIIYNVRYDYDLSGAATNTSVSSNVDLNNKMKCYGYYLEGIFLDKFYNVNNSHAVCDGKSKAFVLMCGIEGIDTMRVGGEAALGEWQQISTPASYENSYYIYKKVSDGSDYYYEKYNDDNYISGNAWINVSGGANGAGGHAWNKVLIDPDDDGEKDWYVVDTTWGDRLLRENTEFLSHSYFLLSDSQLRDTHVANTGHDYPAAEGDFDYYETTFTYNSNTYDYVVESSFLNVNPPKNQLAIIFKYMLSINVKYIEFEVNFSATDGEIRTLVSNALTIAGYVGTSSSSILRGGVACVYLS